MAVRFRAQQADDGPRALAGHPVQLVEVPDQRAWLADPATMHGKAVAMAKLVFEAPTQVKSIEVCLLRLVVRTMKWKGQRFHFCCG